jgi:NAD(P)-dependent dehydrogenase (short-subunit alcohol dehydrogenase family)
VELMSFFQGKTALVTGAGSGIGRALANELADAGCARVVITDIVEARIGEVVEELKRKGVQAGGYQVDHTSPEQVEAFCKRFFEEWGHVDVLCSNAGVGCGGRLEEMSLEDWKWVLDINLWGAIYMMHFFVPEMMKRGQGSILLTASDAGLFSIPGMLAYQTSKHAVVGLGTTLRVELSNHNIKLSMLCPAIINTRIIADGRINLTDSSGECARGPVQDFYTKHGVDPSVPAKAGLRALEKDIGIVISPWSQTGWQYLLWRLSPQLYFGIFRFLWKKGFIHKMFGIEP